MNQGIESGEQPRQPRTGDFVEWPVSRLITEAYNSLMDLQDELGRSYARAQPPNSKVRSIREMHLTGLLILGTPPIIPPTTMNLPVPLPNDILASPPEGEVKDVQERTLKLFEIAALTIKAFSAADVATQDRLVEIAQLLELVKHEVDSAPLV